MSDLQSHRKSGRIATAQTEKESSNDAKKNLLADSFDIHLKYSPRNGIPKECVSARRRNREVLVSCGLPGKRRIPTIRSDRNTRCERSRRTHDDALPARDPLAGLKIRNR